MTTFGLSKRRRSCPDSSTISLGAGTTDWAIRASHSATGPSRILLAWLSGSFKLDGVVDSKSLTGPLIAFRRNVLRPCTAHQILLFARLPPFGIRHETRRRKMR